MKNLNNKKISLVLSGGGTRGIAHIGVLKAIDELGIKIDIISGVSAGAIVGVFYADGKKPDDIYKLFEDKNLFDLSALDFPSNGFFNLKNLRINILNQLNAKTFEDLKINFYCAAVDLNNVKIKYFSKGEIPEKIIASSSIPVLFTPVVIEGITYVDGGLLDNLPVKPVLEKSDIIIASNTNYLVYKDNFEKKTDIIQRVFHTSVNSSVLKNRKKADILIEPKELAKFNILDNSHMEDVFKIGYETAKKILLETFDL
jgi:NTE family protein